MLWTVIVGFLTCVVIFRLYWKLTSGKYAIGNSDMLGKTVLITGASSGIGLETARELAKQGARVYMLNRNLEKSRPIVQRLKIESGNDNIFVIECDVSKLHSVRRCAAAFLESGERIDVLINNAGVGALHGEMKKMTEDGLEHIMATNYFGHFLLTNLLLNKIRRSAPARIINVTSLMHQYAGKFDPSDLTFENEIYSAITAYSRSKLALNLFTRHLAQLLHGTGVTVNCVHPGVIITDIIREFPWPLRMIIKIFGVKYWFKTAKEGAQTILYLACAPELEHVSGHYFNNCKLTATTTLQSLDDVLAENLWLKSIQLTQKE